MGTLRIIGTDGSRSDLGYPGKEPSLEILQKSCGGYVEHLAVDYEGKRRSAYVVDPMECHIPPEKRREWLADNWSARRITGCKIVGPLVIDLGEAHG